VGVLMEGNDIVEGVAITAHLIAAALVRGVSRGRG
jgi:hypothetical protein